ncbi:methyltransferase domain-containing protein [Actinocrinis puniceicyclus]|uniref:Methyltransferase domain-containing protein n=1 Tax=Actinocrinis puniceicyclus TaxID=977794 RepID=A0A8J7WT58_9ACTN|nr:methyltransferase domain-containing protein [Actinocrinis puniceicyclus]MBS2965205.1 methyltransferase domain-containing protein [Actinocrinis puniceicyclus]
MPVQSTTWDPARYLRYADHRARPFHDLLARVPAERPHRVADLGCGPGNATALLCRRWPRAHVVGLDSSAEMIEAATARADRRLTACGRLVFERADLREWRAPEPVDVLITNATLQWVPGHLDLLAALLHQVAPGGWFAMGVPGNFAAPSHMLLGELQRDSRWAGSITGEQFRPASHEPPDYLRALSEAGAQAEVWETTYYYVLPGVDGVLDFVSSTALRPVLAELGGPDTESARGFVSAYADALRDAYPPQQLGGQTVQVLPYRRIFAIARV